MISGARAFRLVAVSLLGCMLFVLTANAQDAGRASADGKARAEDSGAVTSFVQPTAKSSFTTCIDGAAGIHACQAVDLVSFLPRQALGAASNIRLNDIWGWTDPLNGTEYALVGREDGISFVDISVPENLRFVGELPLHPGNVPQVWRDFKVFDDHVFVVADGQGSSTHGMQVFDLTRLRAATGGSPVTFTEDAHYDGVGSAHNIAIDETSGYAFIVGIRASDRCEAGLHIVDISSPTAPAFAGCFRDNVSSYGYTHDVHCVTYHGPDDTYTDREICVGSNVGAVVVADVTDKQNPVMVGAGQYPQSRYIHQGWFTEDHRYFVQDDELDERSYGHGAITRIWDMTELDDPVLAATYESPLPSIDHNLFVRDNLVYASNYSSGLRILSIADPTAPREVASFDTHPPSNAANFDGAWGSYPFFESGNVIVSSRDEGLFVLRLHDVVRVSVSDVSVNVMPTRDASGETRMNVHIGFDVSGEDALSRIEVGAPGSPVQIAQPGSMNAGKRYFSVVLPELSEGIHVVEITAVGTDGTSAVKALESVVVVPDTHTLSAAAPNPAVDRSVVTLAVREAQPVRAILFDAAGRDVRTLLDREVPAGVGLELTVHTAGLSPGVYFMRVEGRNFTESRRIVVTR